MGEANVVTEKMKMMLLCICDEEWCYCDTLVEVEVDPDDRLPDVPCAECKAGHHVWEPEGERA